MKQVMRYTDSDFNVLINEAERFHGHLGPFLVVGLRLGQTGIDALSTKRGDRDLYVTVKLEYTVPISCTLDGIQVATGCTFGNQRLKLCNSKKYISAKFERLGKSFEISISEKILHILKTNISSKKIEQENLHRLASKIATLDNKQLFEEI